MKDKQSTILSMVHKMASLIGLISAACIVNKLIGVIKLGKQHKREQKKKVVMTLIEPYGNWFNDHGDLVNEQAKQALITFYYGLKEIGPNQEYQDEKNMNGRMRYVYYCMKIRDALAEEKYERACNEIISLNHYDLLYQGRVYYNLLNTLNKFMQIEE